MKDANPKVHHTVQGPDRKPPPGFLWTIASKKILKDGLPQGTGIKVKLEVNDAGEKKAKSDRNAWRLAQF